MTPGMSGAIKELADKKKRYLSFVLEFAKQSKSAVGKVDKDDSDYETFMSVIENLIASLNEASESIDDLVFLAKERETKA